MSYLFERHIDDEDEQEWAHDRRQMNQPDPDAEYDRMRDEEN